MLILGITLGMIGKVLLGVAVIRVHLSVARRHKIDDRVVTAIKRERQLSILAIAFILVGYVFEMIALSALSLI